MRNANVLQAAAPLDVIDGGRIERAQAVPKNISFGRLQQESTLADAETGLQVECGERTLLQNDAHLVVITNVFKRRPLLAIQANELSLVFANRTARRRYSRLFKLCPAGDANRFHP